MIIGTAGHVDHGKTSLVRALTGVDTDRLPQERERGLTIELGYAYAALPDGGVLGIVDVPGHERFVHTMAAGATGIDHALLVVAADDGVMPQTHEHLAILTLLGVREGTVALTKVDRVEHERAAEVRAQVAALLADTPLAGAPVFETAATRPAAPGVAALRDHLATVARARAPRRADAAFRLAVDRVFSLPGAGTVVTGTVHSGQVAVGALVQASAGGDPVRVRSIHVQNQPAPMARAGDRCALALAGLSRDAVARGDWIGDPAALQPTTRLDVRLRLLPTADPLQAWTPWHVHLGTTHALAHAVPLDADRLVAGEEGRVQLVFDRSMFALPGDRLIVRNAQATRTVGGGHVLDHLAPERRRRGIARRAWLDALEAAQASDDVAPLLALTPAGLPRSRLAWLLGRTPAAPGAGSGVQVLALGIGDELWLADGAWRAAQDRLLAVLSRWHEQAPDEAGLNAARLARMAFLGSHGSEHDALWHACVDALVREGRLATHGAWLHLPGHAVALTDAERALAQRLSSWLDEGGFDPPWVRDLAARAAVGEDTARHLLRKLSRQGELFQVVKDLFYPARQIEALARVATACAAGNTAGEVRAADFRDATGLGRKRAIQVLEYFDRSGLTRRVRDAHVLRPDAGWPRDR